jgi:tRNA A-37 threonylcarbamoyl transferase component Bud32
MMSIEILEKLVSKRNQVYLIKLCESTDRKYAIMKKYSLNNQKFLEEEYENMQMLQEHGILIPGMIYKSSESLIMEYIQGELVADLLERLDIGDWVDGLASWMAKLHKLADGKSSLLKTDVNLRNFIYSEGQIYGLDFEKVSYGDIRIDLGNICFFILTNTPSFTKEKHIIMRRFLQSYEKHSGIELKDMGRYLLKSKAEAKLRRCQHR